MRLGLRLLRRERRGLPRPRAGRDRRARELRALRPDRRGAGGDAVELPLLAGLPLRRAGADGGQRRPAQARLQRARLRPGHRGGLPAGRAAQGRVHHPAGAEPHRAAADRRPQGRGGDPDRQRGGRRGRRLRGRPAAQEDRPRAGRLGPVHRPGRRRRRAGGGGGDHGADHQLGPELHRRQAVHRRGAGGRRVRRRHGAADGGSGGR